ncbi:TauD/TfdA family dioxygenase [Nocardia vaccinii]|uniref:TauD/TfdA family dioxygenase n=1 Tax=Nocardia vaccinii TaxID=1822 RepID=UPI0008328329|nr:TauD/TfdA family dioxygenase [Nocardia vaccinii]
MPTAIYAHPVDDTMAWTGADVTDKEDFVFQLSPRNIVALESILSKTRGKERDDIVAEDCRHPDLDDDLARLYHEIMFGRGLAVVRGFPVEEHSIEDLERIYWAFCYHLGYPVSNNSFGHRLVRVQEEVLPDGVQPARGTKSRAELAMHNDAADILALLCVYPAFQGGESQFASGPAAHNTILARRPDLLDVLYQGFPHHRRSEQPDDQPDVTPYDVPVFSQVDGRICLNFTYSSILPAMKTLGREFTAEQQEAIDLLRQVLVEQQVEFRLESGEAVVANNFAMCHSRSDFVSSNDPKKARCFLRAWMEVPRTDRRLPLGREYFHMENKDLRLGYDPVAGRDGSIARNDYANVSPELAEMFRAAQAKPKAGGK